MAYLLYVQTILTDKPPEPTALVWIAFALSVLYLMLIPVVISCALDAVRPRNIVVPILERIDERLLSRMNHRYGSHEFAPLPLDNNPLLEIESMTAAFLRQGEVGLATATFGGLIQTLGHCAQPSHYEALCWHAGLSVRQIARVLITLHNDELLRELVRMVAHLHHQTFNAEFAGDYAYTKTSWPKVLLDIGRECVHEGFPEGARWCEIGLGWMARTDCKNLPPESKNYWLQYILNKDHSGEKLKPTGQEERIRMQFENFDRLFVHSMAGIAENAGSAAGIVIRDMVSSYRHLGFTFREELKQEHVHTRQDALWGISYELRELIKIAERAGAWEALLDFKDVGSLADFSLRDGDGTAATALLRVECDALLRAAEGGVDCGELQMSIIILTCDGCLSGLDKLPDGLEMVKVSVETLCKLASLMPTKYAGHGLGEEYDRVYEELGSRLLQIKRSGQVKNPVPQDILEKVDSALAKYWPNLKDK